MDRIVHVGTVELRVETFGVAVAAFAATNVDDLLILALFFADPSVRPAHVVVGQYLSIAALIALSGLGAWAALLAPVAWVHWLGVIPILIGLKQALSKDEDAAPAGARQQGGLGATTLAAAGVTFANGGDNIGV